MNEQLTPALKLSSRSTQIKDYRLKPPTKNKRLVLPDSPGCSSTDAIRSRRLLHSSGSVVGSGLHSLARWLSGVEPLVSLINDDLRR